MNNTILYFITGEVPTNEEFEAASRFMNTGPIFQFISLVDLDLNGHLIANKGVAGAVPEQYKEFPILDIPAAAVVQTVAVLDTPKAKK